MTDTVNVPVEILERLVAWINREVPVPTRSATRWAMDITDLLASAPKAGPVSDHYKLEAALQDAKRAVAFFDQVRAASQDEQIAVGTDHHKWLQSSIRALAAFADQPLSNPQQLEGEEAAWAWVNGRVECDPADIDYSADELVDAFMAGKASRRAHPAPSSELLEAKAMVLDHLMSAEIDGRTAKARLIEYRTGVLAITKHKGPQSSAGR